MLLFSEIIQEMRSPLAVKIKAKRALDRELLRRQTSRAPRTGFKRHYDTFKEWWLRVKEFFKDVYWWTARILRRGIWWSRGKRIRKIEGLYGTGVGSYFVFLRFLALLNLCVAMIR